MRGKRPAKLGGHVDLHYEVLTRGDLGTCRPGRTDLEHAVGARVADDDGNRAHGRAFVAEEPQVDEQHVGSTGEIDGRERVAAARRALTDDPRCAVTDSETVHDFLQRAGDPAGVSHKPP